MQELFQRMNFADYLILAGYFLAPITAWSIYFYLLLARRENPLPLRPRNEVPWGAIDVFALGGLFLITKLVGQLAAISIIAQKEGLSPTEVTSDIAYRYAQVLAGANSISSLLQFAVAIGWLRLRQKSNLSDLGFSLQNWRKDLSIGLVAGSMIIPVALILNLLIHVWLKIEYNHDVLKMIRYSLVFTAVSTVLVAPLVEEFHFRVLLQGWLQRVKHLTPTRMVQLIHGNDRAEQLNAARQEPDSVSKSSSPSDSKKSRKPRLDAHKKGDHDSAPQELSVPWWPILVSSLVFASMHAGQGAAPYTLFVFAVGLGYLYRQTNSILPCLVVHFLLNLWSYVSLVSNIFS